MNIIVTGCGGDIGQSIGKILKSEQQFNKVIGCDIHLQHAGIFIFDKCFIVPKVSEISYFEEVNILISEYEIDVIIVASEPELRFISMNNCRELYKCNIIIMPNDEALKIGFDKYRTAKFLFENSLPFPKTILFEEFKGNFYLPVIAKDRFGAGSKNILYINDLEELLYYQKKLSNYILQEFLPPTEGEFTCGVFRHGTIFRSIIFKRNLLGGFSGYGEVVESEEIYKLLKALADLLKLEGSINVQLRIVNGIPFVFEINPRFSSTVLFRHMMGFRDVIWAIYSKKNILLPEYTPPKANSKFFKGFSEFVELEK